VNAKFASNIRGYFVYAALKGFSFGLVTAMWVIYLQRQHGVSLTEVTLIDVAFWIAAALGEIPTGIVADSFGRKASLAAGAALMGVSLIAWTFAPTVPLIMAAYMFLAVGATFLSGAEEAFFYESLQIMGRGGDYTRLVGRVSAVSLACIALGNLASGLVASIDLRLPFIIAGLDLLVMLGIVLTFKEPRSDAKSGGQGRKSYREVLQQSAAIMRARPNLRFSMFYLALVPMTAVVMETVFLQPQAVALGVPIAGIGMVVMAVQLTNMAGSTWSDRIKRHFGEARVLYAAPAFIVSSLFLLAALQVFPALLFVAVIGFVTAVLRPLVLSRIQKEVPDDIRATILSMQSLVFTILVAIGEPMMGFVADQSGLPAAYVGLGASLSILIVILFVKSRQHVSEAAVSI
jgi:MFS family permease